MKKSFEKKIKLFFFAIYFLIIYIYNIFFCAISLHPLLPPANASAVNNYSIGIDGTTEKNKRNSVRYNPWPHIGQIIIELHLKTHFLKKLDGSLVRPFLQLFYDRGFGMFRKDLNLDAIYCVEYSFIRRDKWPLMIP